MEKWQNILMHRMCNVYKFNVIDMAGFKKAFDEIWSTLPSDIEVEKEDRGCHMYTLKRTGEYYALTIKEHSVMIEKNNKTSKYEIVKDNDGLLRAKYYKNSSSPTSEKMLDEILNFEKPNYKQILNNLMNILVTGEL